MSEDNTNSILPNLTSSQMASARQITFQKSASSASNDAGWNVEASIAGRDSNALLHSLYKFNATEGDTLDLFSVSFFDPYLLRVYDKNGNILVTNNESNDPPDSAFMIDGIGHGSDCVKDFMATYTGTYYVEASWNQGSFYTFYDLIIGVDTDTSLDQRADEIFSWAESQYPDLFSGHSQSQEIAGYHARIYADSGTALGEKNGDIYFYDAWTETTMIVGTVNDFPI